MSRAQEPTSIEKTRFAVVKHWQRENREAIDWHNALTERMGGTLQDLLDSDDRLA